MPSNFRISLPDLVNHLRAIHQSVFLVGSALLLAVIFAETPDDISIAVQNLDKLQEITAYPNWDDNFVADEFYALPGIGGDRLEFYKNYDIEFPVPEFYRTGKEASPNHVVYISAPLDTLVG